MRVLLIITGLLFFHISVVSQTVDKELQIEQVQTALSRLISNDQSGELMLRDLTELEGKVAKLEYDTFDFSIKGVNQKRVAIKIRYEYVLVIKGKNVSISFIPDPNLSPFGTWDDVMKIRRNHYLEVVPATGQSVEGRVAEITKDAITLLGEKDGEKVLLPREQISYVYRVRNKSGGVLAGTLDGSSKGNKVGRKVGDVVSSTPSGEIFTTGVGTIVGTAVGAVSGAIKKETKLRVLIYSE